MDEQKIAKIYLIVYLWLLVVLQSILMYVGTELESPRGIMNTVFTYLAFIPAFGYTHDKQIPSKGLWRLFIILFFLWQIASFSFLYPLEPRVKSMQVLMLLPLYWSLVGYAMITVHQDGAKKAAIIQKKDDFKERSKTIIGILGSLSMLLLLISLYVIISSYWKLQQLMSQ